MRKKAFKAAAPCTFPVLMGYLFLGIAFGVSLVSKGYHFCWAIFMSLIIYAGSGQFLAVALLSGGASVLTSAFMTFMVNARHLFYGLSMFDKFEGMKAKKPYMIFSLTDETYSLIYRTKVPEGIDKNYFYFFIALLDHFYWIMGGAIGALAGSLIKFNPKGIDFAMTSLFIVIFVEQWESAKSNLPAILGIVATVIALMLVGTKEFILLSMMIIMLCLILLRGKLEPKLKEDTSC